MNFYAISGLINAVTFTVLGLFVYLKNTKGIINKKYALFCLSVAAWSYSYFIWQLASDKDTALFWSRALMSGAIFVSVCFLDFTVTWLGVLEKNKKIIFYGYILCFIFLALDFTPLFVKGVAPKLNFKYWPEPGITYSFFLLMFFGYAIYSIGLMCKAYRISTGNRRNQMKYVLIGTIIGYLGGSTNYPLWYNINILPIGNPFVAVYTLIVFYAIAKHKLMDINIVIGKGITYIFISIFVVLIYATLIWGLDNLFPSYNPTLLHLLAFIVIIIPFIYFIPRLKLKTEKIIERALFKDKYNYRQVLKQALEAIVTILNLNELLRYIITIIKQNFKAENIAIFIKEEETGLYKLETSYGIKRNRYTVKDGIVEWLKETKKVFIREEQEQLLTSRIFKDLYKEMAKVRANIIIPLFYKNDLKGILTLGNKANGEPYFQEDIELLLTLASQSVIAIENAKLYNEAITDTLTRVYNRRYFEARLREEISNAKRYMYPISLLMIDIDNFKEINDRYGHLIGDEILQKVSKILKKNIREGDILARYGGDEFSLLLPHTSWSVGRKVSKEQLKRCIEISLYVAEKLRKKVEEQRIKEMRVTISIGIGYFEGRRKDIGEGDIIMYADKALYKAKERGRNKVVVYTF